MLEREEIMEKEILEIIARAPELSQLGTEYINYLIIRLFVKTGVALFLISIIIFVVYKAVSYANKERDKAGGI